jgi:uncharacterized protein YjbI with pentapeptide repeats
VLAPLVAAAGPAGARLSLKEVSAALAKAGPGARADFAGRDLSYLDLSGLDFKQADLSGASLFGADLTDANLSGAMLTEANLDRTIIIRANFAGAHLAHASLMAVVAYPTLDTSSGPAPSFAGADLTGARIVARLGHADLRGAILTDARLGYTVRELRTNLYSDLSGAELSEAKLVRADLRRVRLAFAHLSHADLSGADLRRADLFHADLTGADLTGADLTDADIAETLLRPSAPPVAGSDR